MKSTTTAKVEHRLQVAFYHAMLARLFEQAGLSSTRDPDRHPLPRARGRRDPARRRRPDGGGAQGCPLPVRRGRAAWRFVAEPHAYLESVADLVTGPGSVARRVSQALRRAPLPPHLQVRRVPVQRVLHEVERGARRPLAHPPSHRPGQGRAAPLRRHHRPGACRAEGVPHRRQSGAKTRNGRTTWSPRREGDSGRRWRPRGPLGRASTSSSTAPAVTASGSGTRSAP